MNFSEFITRANELKPCPFCGGDARLISYGESGIGACVACNNCHACTDDYDTDQPAVAAWNSRHEE